MERRLLFGRFPKSITTTLPAAVRGEPAMPMGWNVLRKIETQADRRTYGGVVSGKTVCVRVTTG